jgi:hypothetical protein
MRLNAAGAASAWRWKCARRRAEPVEARLRQRTGL